MRLSTLTVPRGYFSFLTGARVFVAASLKRDPTTMFAHVVYPLGVYVVMQLAFSEIGKVRSTNYSQPFRFGLRSLTNCFLVVSERQLQSPRSDCSLRASMIVPHRCPDSEKHRWFFPIVVL